VWLPVNPVDLTRDRAATAASGTSSDAATGAP
jgi:hypothetical protein